MVCICLILLGIPQVLNYVCQGVILVTTVYSGIEYFAKNATCSKRSNDNKKERRKPFFFVVHQEKRESLLRKSKRTPQKTTEKMAPTKKELALQGGDCRSFLSS